MTVAELTALGYAVTAAPGGMYRVAGFGVDTYLRVEEFDAFAVPAVHVERRFQFERQDAHRARGRLIGDGHTVTRPDPLVDRFDVAGPVVNAAGLDADGLVGTGAQLDAAEAAWSGNERTLRDRADQAVGTLQNAWDNWGALTNAQKDAALKLTVRVVIALVRLTLRKLDAT